MLEIASRRNMALFEIDIERNKTLRHSREGGNPCGVRSIKLTMGSRLRGNDGEILTKPA